MSFWEIRIAGDPVWNTMQPLAYPFRVAAVIQDAINIDLGVFDLIIDRKRKLFADLSAIAAANDLMTAAGNSK